MTADVGRMLARRTAIIFGLSALAIVQPLLDLFGRNPEFFVAGNYSTSQIVWFALGITLLPPLVAVALTAVATVIDERAGTAVFAVACTVFGGLFTMALLERVGVDQVVVVFVLALAAGVGIAVLALRTLPGRLLLSYLAVANVAFVGLFLFASPTAKLIASGATGDLGRVTVPDIDAPVVVIVLDEFPIASIILPDGTINADRYPGFARLAEVSTWFRNASAQDNLTHRSVPSILDGNLPTDDSLPIYADHERNLFTLLGGELPIERYESVTDMCPTELCGRGERQSLRQAFADARVVYGHRVLPPALAEDLPSIDDSWGAFGVDDAAGATNDHGDEEVPFIDRAYARWRGLSADERSPLGQAGILADQIDALGDEPVLLFSHVALPHRPWVLSRTGITTSFLPDLVTDPEDPAYAFENRMEFQFSAMQLGAADALVGELVDRLQSLPHWEDTLLVVTSDHGTNLTPPDLGRMRITDANRDEALRIPLFVKAPGQVDGDVRDDVAQTIDVLPSIVDLLGIETDWTFAGHSLYDGSTPTVEPRVSSDVEALFDIAARRAVEFPHGTDWMAVAAVGEHGALVGREVDEFELGEPSAHTITIDQADEFADLPTADGQMPFGLSCTVHGDDEPPELVVAVNGTLAGVIGGFGSADGGWSCLGYVADLYVEGANDVAVFEVDADGTTLHEVARR